MNEQPFLKSFGPARRYARRIVVAARGPASLSRPVYVALLVLLVGLGFGSAGCAGVRPEQRAILADPTMVPQSDPMAAEAREHVFDKREGAFGGGSVQGGGCGCN